MPKKRTSVIWSVTKEEFLKLYNEAIGYTDLLRKFGLENKGGNHKTLKIRIREEGLSEDRLKTYCQSPSNKIKSIDMFVENSTTHRHAVKKRVISEKLIEYKCEVCGLLPVWENKKLVLVLDHKNGKSNDHRLENLRFLCPNCNSQTDTFAGKNQFHPSSNKELKKRKENKCECGILIKSTNKRCKNCYHIFRKRPNFSKRKVIRPNKEWLEQLIYILPFTEIAKIYDVSDNAVRQWCKRYSLEAPNFETGFWLKSENIVDK